MNFTRAIHINFKQIFKEFLIKKNLPFKNIKSFIGFIFVDNYDN